MKSQFVLYILVIFRHFEGNLSDLSTHPGHLKPLGSNCTIVNVDSVEYFPNPRDFYSKYVEGSRPLVIRGGAKLSPAFKLWTDEYLASIEEGKKEIVVVEQAKKENRTLTPEEIPFTDFVKRYKDEDIYLVNDLPHFLSKDVSLPTSLLCEDIVKHMVAKMMWFSSGGTKSVLHTDSAENINCLFDGMKHFYLIDPNKYEKNVTIENTKSAYSNVDVERVDFLKYPGLAEVEYHYVQMQAGDCLYIPYLWYHHVSSFHRNIAVNVWWSPSAKPQLDKCNVSNTTLNELTFIGFDALLPKEALDGLKVLLKKMFIHYGTEAVNIEDFKWFFQEYSDVFEDGATWSDDMTDKLVKIFSYIEKPVQDDLLTIDDIKSLDEDTWEKVASLAIKLTEQVNEQFEQDSDDGNYEVENDDSRHVDKKDEL